jgi:hypothetical protein
MSHQKLICLTFAEQINQNIYVENSNYGQR